MDSEQTDLDLPLLAVLWTHTARTLMSRIREFDDRLSATTSGDLGALTQGDMWDRDADAHFAFLAFAHVVKVCDLVPELPDFPDAKVLILLRNFAEHWDDPNGRSARALDSQDFDPMALGVLFVADLEYLMGDRRDAISGWLDETERIARSLAADDDEPLPFPTEPFD